MKNDIWFPAKRYGWGWGLPVRWQGWLVLVAYVGLVSASISVWRPYPAFSLAGTGVLSGLLILICWFKGDRPRWRWGDKNSEE